MLKVDRLTPFPFLLSFSGKPHKIGVSKDKKEQRTIPCSFKKPISKV